MMLSRLRDWLRAASHTIHIGPITITIWPWSLPWLIQYRRRSRWIGDRGQNTAPGRGPCRCGYWACGSHTTEEDQ